MNSDDDNDLDNHIEQDDEEKEEFDNDEEDEDDEIEDERGVEDEEIAQENLFFPASKVATTTCLHQYANKRMEGAQNKQYKWSPLMKYVNKYISNPRLYNRPSLYTDRNLAALELLLKGPIWLKLKYGEEEIAMDTPGVLDFSGQFFHESLVIVKDLLNRKWHGMPILNEDDLRDGVIKQIRTMERFENVR